MQTQTRQRPENLSPANTFKRKRCPIAVPHGDGYRFPRVVHDRLTTVLEPYRNRDEAYALALYLVRHWALPNRIDLAFPVVRRAGEAKGQGTWGGLCDVSTLGMTQGQIRGARDLLERVDFLTRTIPPNRVRHRATEDGSLRRKAVLFTFAPDYKSAFKAANARAAAARKRQEGERRALTPSSPLMASTARFSPPNLPKDKSPPERTVLMGRLEKTCGFPALAFDLKSPLDAALARLSQGVFGEAGAIPEPERGEGGG